MKNIRFTLVADGSSDRLLLPILKWAIEQATVDYAVQGDWANLWGLPVKTRAERIKEAVYRFPCEILFIHRDAEAEAPTIREEEIRRALAESEVQEPAVCVIPVRMSEAWLLLDEQAIRDAAGNPNGAIRLELPVDPEAIPDPKSILHDLLVQASELSRRRRRSFSPEKQAFLITQRTTDFRKLRALTAFRTFESELRLVLGANGYLEQRTD